MNWFWILALITGVLFIVFVAYFFFIFERKNQAMSKVPFYTSESEIIYDFNTQKFSITRKIKNLNSKTKFYPTYYLNPIDFFNEYRMTNSQSIIFENTLKNKATTETRQNILNRNFLLWNVVNQIGSKTKNELNKLVSLTFTNFDENDNKLYGMLNEVHTETNLEWVINNHSCEDYEYDVIKKQIDSKKINFKNGLAFLYFDFQDLKIDNSLWYLNELKKSFFILLSKQNSLNSNLQIYFTKEDSLMVFYQPTHLSTNEDDLISEIKKEFEQNVNTLKNQLKIKQIEFKIDNFLNYYFKSIPKSKIGFEEIYKKLIEFRFVKATNFDNKNFDAKDKANTLYENSLLFDKVEGLNSKSFYSDYSLEYKELKIVNLSLNFDERMKFELFKFTYEKCEKLVYKYIEVSNHFSNLNDDEEKSELIFFNFRLEASLQFTKNIELLSEKIIINILFSEENISYNTLLLENLEKLGKYYLNKEFVFAFTFKTKVNNIDKILEYIRPKYIIFSYEFKQMMKNDLESSYFEEKMKKIPSLNKTKFLNYNK